MCSRPWSRSGTEEERRGQRDGRFQPATKLKHRKPSAVWRPGVLEETIDRKRIARLAWALCGLTTCLAVVLFGTTLLSQDLLGVVHGIVQPNHASLWLRPPEARP